MSNEKLAMRNGGMRYSYSTLLTVGCVLMHQGR